MKNNRVTARRILQGGATFAALGALGIATALPAAADTQVAGWAHAEVGYGVGAATTYVIPQGQQDSASNGGEFAIGDYFSINASTSATVNASGASSTTTVHSARVVLTASDIGEIVEGIEDPEDPSEEPSEEPSEDPSQEPSEDPSEEPSGEPEEPGDETGETDEDTGETGDGTDESGETGGSDEGADESEEPTDETDGEETGGSETGGTGAEDELEAEDEPEADAGAGDDTQTGDETGGGESGPEGTDGTSEADQSSSDDVVVLDDAEQVANGEEIVLDATITGASVTTTQSWSGEITRSHDAGTVSYTVNEVAAEFDNVYIGAEGINEVNEAGYAWEDAYSRLDVDVVVPEQFREPLVLGTAVAGLGVASTDDGNGGGDDGGSDNGGDDGNNDDGDDGDEQNPPTRDPEELDMPEPKPAESLAQTGNPLTGLIAAGAAIAAGGGVAAFFARRKKNAADSAAETSEG